VREERPSPHHLSPFSHEISTTKRQKRPQSESSLEPSPEVNMDYLQLLEDARRVIDSMTSTIEVMSSRMTKLQHRQQNISVNEDLFQEPILCNNLVSDESAISPISNSSVVVVSTAVDTESAQWVPDSMWKEPAQDVPITAVELRISSPTEPLWYAERPYPPFTVDVVDPTTQRKVVANGWKLTIDMIDGFGNNAADKLSGTGQYPGYLFPVVNGSATVTGIRFRAVSSKCGGYFQIVVSATCPDPELIPKPVLTSNIQVLSYRLYHAPKVPYESLRPDDSISKMKGIGSLYAKRLQALGIERVSQLAAIDINTMGEQGIKALLGTIRKDRGALTPAKLTDYIQQARNIVARSPAQIQANHTHTVARSICIEKRHPSGVMPWSSTSQESAVAP
jgi:hypothetical protein